MAPESKAQLADLAQTASAAQVQRLTCPTCAGSLTIQYTDRGKGALSVLCPRCPWRVVTDGLREPPWVKELGRKVETAQGETPGPSVAAVGDGNGSGEPRPIPEVASRP